jgi:nucleoside-triphosphatase THEP1
MNIYLLCGQQGSGKSEALQVLAAYLGDGCGGVICPGIFWKGKKIGTDALDLMTGKQIPFARLSVSSGGMAVGRYRIQPEGIDHGLKAIERAVKANRVVIIDEVGPLEIRCHGLYTGIQKAVSQASDVLLVVRSSLKKEVVNHFCIKNHVPLLVEEDLVTQWQCIANYNTNKCI